MVQVSDKESYLYTLEVLKPDSSLPPIANTSFPHETRVDPTTGKLLISFQILRLGNAAPKADSDLVSDNMKRSKTKQVKTDFESVRQPPIRYSVPIHSVTLNIPLCGREVAVVHCILLIGLVFMIITVSRNS
jgi:hypothetical protein